MERKDRKGNGPRDRIKVIDYEHGGVHGTNRLGGNAMTDCIVFDRVAGKNAPAEARFD